MKLDISMKNDELSKNDVSYFDEIQKNVIVEI